MIDNWASCADENVGWAYPATAPIRSEQDMSPKTNTHNCAEDFKRRNLNAWDAPRHHHFLCTFANPTMYGLGPLRLRARPDSHIAGILAI